MTEETAPEGVKAGWHLWLVGVVGVLWNGFGCFDFTMTATRNAAYLEPYPKEMVEYWFAMPWWMWAIWAVGVFGGLAGSILLLLKRAWAVQVLAASFLAALVSMIIGATAKDAPKMEGSEIFTVVILGIALGLLVYAFWQHRRGILR